MPPLSATSNRPVAVERKQRKAKAKRAYTLPHAFHAAVTSERVGVSRPAPAVQPGPFRQAEVRKVDRNSRTRPYYRAHVAAWLHSPEAKSALRQQERGVKLLKTARTKADRQTAHALLAASSYVLQERRRPPDKVAANAYRAYTDRLWGRASQFYPRPGDEPGFKLDYSAPDEGALAFVEQGSDRVHYGPQVTREFMEPEGFGRAESKVVPLHEWTHTRQSPETWAKAPVREGGAQANEQRLAQLLALKPVESSPEYEAWADMVRRRLGAGWVSSGQFGG